MMWQFKKFHLLLVCVIAFEDHLCHALLSLSFVQGTGSIKAACLQDDHLPMKRMSGVAGLTDVSRDVFSCRTRALSKRINKNFSALMAQKKQNSENRDYLRRAKSNSSISLAFAAAITLCGAMLGPFLDSYHSAFDVLRYDNEITFILPFLGGTVDHPAFTTTWWVPELFGLAGFIIGWLYILLDDILLNSNQEKARIDGILDEQDQAVIDRRLKPSPPVILAGISCFTFQYYLSGILFEVGFGRSAILNVMSVFAAAGFLLFDNTISGLIVSTATSIGGPLIEVGLITFLKDTGYGYHYTDPGETGFFPLWILPVYFLGGPAVGNLARGIWNSLEKDEANYTTANPYVNEKPRQSPNCSVCNDTRCVGCPNCEAQGYYITYNRKVKCNCCKGRGLVICRSCFQDYGDDPSDIEKIRDIMSRMPD